MSAPPGIHRTSERRRVGPALFLLLPAICLLVVFVAAPLGWVFRVSFNEQAGGTYMVPGFTIAHYARFLGDFWYLSNVLWFSVEIAALTTAVDVVLAYPLALYVARCTGRRKQILYTLVLAPLLIGLISLVFGWIVLFRGNGLLNAAAMWIGLTSEPIRYMYTVQGMIILLIYIGIPFVVLSLLDSLERIEPALIEAATNSGANQWQCFRRIIFPMTLPGLYAGSIVVFALNFSAFAIPLMVGPPETNMIGLVVFRQAMQLGNLPFASAISVVMISVSVLVILIYGRLLRRFFRRLGAKV